MIVPYMKSEIYSVDYNVEYEVYIVVDRMSERITEESFKSAALAIAWAEEHYEGLVSC